MFEDEQIVFDVLTFDEGTKAILLKFGSLGDVFVIPISLFYNIAVEQTVVINKSSHEIRITSL